MSKFRHQRPGEDDPISDEEIEAAVEAGDIKPATPEMMRKHFLEASEIVLSDGVRQQLAEAGMSEDEFIAMLMKEMGITN